MNKRDSERTRRLLQDKLRIANETIERANRELSIISTRIAEYEVERESWRCTRSDAIKEKRYLEADLDDLKDKTGRFAER